MIDIRNISRFLLTVYDIDIIFDDINNTLNMHMVLTLYFMPTTHYACDDNKLWSHDNKSQWNYCLIILMLIVAHVVMMRSNSSLETSINNVQAPIITSFNYTPKKRFTSFFELKRVINLIEMNHRFNYLFNKWIIIF